MPMNNTIGSTCDISTLLWKTFYFNSDNSNFPSTSKEELGRFVGISENLGNDTNFSILNLNINKGISRSNVRPEVEYSLPNIISDPLTAPEVVKYRHVENDNAELPSNNLEDDNEPSSCNSSPKKTMPIIDSNDLVKRTFIHPQEDG